MVSQAFIGVRHCLSLYAVVNLAGRHTLGAMTTNDNELLSELTNKLRALLEQAYPLLDAIDQVVTKETLGDLLTVNQACHALGVSRATLYKWHRQWESDTRNGVNPPRGIRLLYPFGEAMPRIRRTDIEHIIRGRA